MAIFSMVSHMVFLTKLDFENLKNLVTPSPFCKVGRVTELQMVGSLRHLEKQNIFGA